MKEKEVLYIKENIVMVITAFLGTTIIGSMTVYFAGFALTLLEINQLKDYFSILPIALFFLGLMGLWLCFGALSYFIKIIRRPYIKLSLEGIEGNAIKKPLLWNDIDKIESIEVSTGYLALLQILAGGMSKPGRMTVCQRIMDSTNDEKVINELAKVYITDKSGNKYKIFLENGSLIKDQITNFMRENNITL